MAKHKLSDKIDLSFLLWGINTGNSVHRLCWQLNQLFEWNLTRREDILDLKASREIFIPGKDIDKPDADLAYEFPLFSFEDEALRYSVDVIHNKTEGAAFINELKHVDYLLIVKGSFVLLPEDIKKKTSTLEGIQSVMSIEPSRLNKAAGRLQQYTT
jgi:hypothetical protein